MLMFRLVGDVLLATAFLSYSGPFNQEFRDLLMNSWKKEMRRNKIPFSEVNIQEKLLRVFVAINFRLGHMVYINITPKKVQKNL